MLKKAKKTKRAMMGAKYIEEYICPTSEEWSLKLPFGVVVSSVVLHDVCISYSLCSCENIPEESSFGTV